MRLRSRLALRRLRSRLPLLLLLYFPICRSQRWWSLHIVIGREGCIDGHMIGTAMIRTGILSFVTGGSALILQLRLHGSSVRLMHRCKLRWPRRRTDTARATVVTHMGVVVVHDRAVIDVVHYSDVDVVDGAVVVVVASPPIAALVAVANVAEAVINPAIIADVLAPVAGVKAVGVIPVAPVAGGPERALVGSLDPCAGHPEITVRRPGPIAGSPDIAVAGILWLVVDEQRRRRLVSGIFGLFAIARIIRRLVRRRIRSIALIRRRPLLVAGCGCASVVRSGGQIGRCRV